ncbi:MAG: Rv1355c family protein [Flavobacteriales bacterium]|nr:hypothetical protein [Flavobacteriales bacterium]MCC6577071.1 Rv1355c family protein [Flavobacteriales bacterium]NUQ15426.1 Rv1355c family protein [Flavobacteriales bacterium]
MDKELRALLREAGTDTAGHTPRIFRMAVDGDRAELGRLFAGGLVHQVHDRLQDQLRELVKMEAPARQFTAAELERAAQERLQGTPAEAYGVWVFHPWSGRLVHLLDEAEFARVRTDRNRNKITTEEQQLLATKKVGVIGLSVGRSVAMALALERSFGEIRLADHDRLDLSNLNRIKAGAHELGLNKCVATAREIAEIDPFLKVVCFPEGIDRGNIDAFLTEGGKLDILVEECDSVDIKILARQHAKAHRIPVVMDTSDRGMLDVERFDLEPDRPLLHGLIDHLDLAAAATARTNEEKLPFLAPMAGMDALSPRMKASLVEVGQSILTWPQLATGVQLGGALVGDVHRRIVLGEMNGSGRWYVDLEELVTGTTGVVMDGRTAPDDHADASDPAEEESYRTHAPLAVTAAAARIPDALALRMAEAARLAPSADNMQPWKVRHKDGHLLLHHDRARSRSALDSESMIPHISLGMCLENMLLASAGAGTVMEPALFPASDDPSLIAVLYPAGGRGPSALDGALAAQIAARHTDRTHGNGGPLRPGDPDALQAAVAAIPGAALHLTVDRSEIDRIADLCGKADRLRIMNEHGHAEFFTKQLRWSHEEAVRSGDGLDIETLELTATERVGLRMASSSLAMRTIRRVSGGKALEKLTANAVRSASAVALLTMPRIDDVHCLEGGRAAQRLWLKATELGLAVHPLSAPIFLARPARRPQDPSLTAPERAEALALYTELTEVFRLRAGEPVFMVRLSRTAGPSTRSVRRPLNAVYTTNDH